MTAQVTITLSNNISERLQKLAQQRQQDVIAVVESILDDGLPENLEGQDWIDLSEPDAAAEQEMQAYIALHPMLKQKYFGKHVAIYRGKLVDYDKDHSALYARINEKYPNEFVWMSKVEDEPIGTLFFRSFRFE